MNIGIAGPFDLSTIKDYLFKEDQKKLVSQPITAPALHNLVSGLIQAGHHVTVITKHPEANALVLRGESITVAIAKSFSLYPFQYLHGGWLNVKPIAELIEKHIDKLDLIHTHWTYEYTIAALKFKNKIPIVCTVRDWCPYILKNVRIKDKIGWIMRYFMFIKIFKSNGISFIANSTYTSEKIKSRWGQNSTIIPNPISDIFIKNEKKVFPDCPRIVSVSVSNDKRKNITNLVIAFQMLRKEYPHAILSLVGPPFNESDSQIKKWKSHNLLDNVEILGRKNHDDLIKILDESTLMVHPAYEETFGNVLIEAMARKLPVIGGEKSGAVPYVLDYGNAGCLCNISSVESIKSSMIKVLTDTTYRNKLVTGANEQLKKFSIINITTAHLKYYENLIDRKL